MPCRILTPTISERYSGSPKKANTANRPACPRMPKIIVVRQPSTYRIVLADEDGHKNDPAEHTITVLEDQPPKVEIAKPTDAGPVTADILLVDPKLYDVFPVLAEGGKKKEDGGFLSGVFGFFGRFFGTCLTRI